KSSLPWQGEGWGGVNAGECLTTPAYAAADPLLTSPLAGGGTIQRSIRLPTRLSRLIFFQAQREPTTPATSRVTALQLDLEAQVIGGVRVLKRFVLGNLAALPQLEQRLVEGLHAQVGGLLHDLLDAVHLAPLNQLAHGGRAHQNLDGGAALAVYRRNQALGHEGPQVQGQIHQQLGPAFLREEVDD